MIIVNAFILAISATNISDGFDHYQELATRLDHQIEWIDQDGSSLRSRSEAKQLLNALTVGLDDESFSVRHTSEWKNGQCFRIIQIRTSEKVHRVFFQCAKKNGHDSVVTKIKVD